MSGVWLCRMGRVRMWRWCKYMECHCITVSHSWNNNDNNRESCWPLYCPTTDPGIVTTGSLQRVENINQSLFADLNKAEESAGSQEETAAGRVISTDRVSVVLVVIVHTHILSYINTTIRPVVVEPRYPGHTSPRLTWSKETQSLLWRYLLATTEPGRVELGGLFLMRVTGQAGTGRDTCEHWNILPLSLACQGSALSQSWRGNNTSVLLLGKVWPVGNFSLTVKIKGFFLVFFSKIRIYVHPFFSHWEINIRKEFSEILAMPLFHSAPQC